MVTRQRPTSPLLVEVASGWEVSITLTPGGYTAIVRRRVDVAGSGAYRLEVLAVRTPTACIATVLRDAGAAILNDLADAEPYSFLEQPS